MEIPYVVSMYMCITTQIGSSLPDLFTTSWSPSHSGHSVLHYIHRFVYVEPPLHPWDETDLVMVSNPSDVLLDSVCHYFIEDFCTDVH
jgi:hypothetical protein